jgi:hypothetical protein
MSRIRVNRAQAQAQLMKIWVKLVKRFELKNLAQARLITIRANSRADSWANAYTLTQFDIYI